MERASVDPRAVPPVETLYHFRLEPAAERSETFGKAAEQNAWLAFATGASGVVLTVTATRVLALSQPLDVWLT
ncbi:hypothetical protein [Pontibacter cellulosilyticus]|uniref:Uncharacterized protein n=1 Tax=Pontibacter cellulosilyticus TaxID=1720253 RepID=A0A923SM45_9BACT|nr:hypothetical protein [Pontibacter cellulosilyticus]MBC5991810.1 hypothetical protein [Pontibacter cellulosilyticus]